MEVSSGRISETAFKVVVGLFFGLAIFATSVRMVIRLRDQNRLRLDDYFLLFSCVCLIAATGLLYGGMRAIFFVAALTINPGIVFAAGISQAEILDQAIYFQRVNWSYLAISWTSIFAVKFGFLSFFRHLVDRIPSVHALWKGVVWFTVMVWVFAVCDAFIACPKLGLASFECTATPAATRKALALGITTICLDIVTDVLILMIPVLLLWRVQVKPRQKLGLAVFLCLSVCMAIVAIIRVCGLHYKGTFDNTWIFLWQQVECCVAVTMLSLTAFRSIFVSAQSKKSEKKARARLGVFSGMKLFPRTPQNNSAGPLVDDISIPGAQLTGMSRWMGRTKTAQSMDEELVSQGT